jgi:flagellar motor switch protein FliN
MTSETMLHAVSSAHPQTTQTAQVISLVETQAEPFVQASTPSGSALLVSHFNPLHAVRTRLQVCVGDIELTVGELLAAKEHQVLLLNRAVDEPIELLLEGKVVARGQLVAVDGHFGVRITELPVPLKT